MYLLTLHLGLGSGAVRLRWQVTPAGRAAIYHKGVLRGCESSMMSAPTPLLPSQHPSALFCKREFPPFSKALRALGDVEMKCWFSAFLGVFAKLWWTGPHGNGWFKYALGKALRSSTCRKTYIRGSVNPSVKLICYKERTFGLCSWHRVPKTLGIS